MDDLEVAIVKSADLSLMLVIAAIAVAILAGAAMVWTELPASDRCPAAGTTEDAWEEGPTRPPPAPPQGGAGPDGQRSGGPVG